MKFLGSFLALLLAVLAINVSTANAGTIVAYPKHNYESAICKISDLVDAINTSDAVFLDKINKVVLDDGGEANRYKNTDRLGNILLYKFGEKKHKDLKFESAVLLYEDKYDEMEPLYLVKVSRAIWVGEGFFDDEALGIGDPDNPSPAQYNDIHTTLVVQFHSNDIVTVRQASELVYLTIEREPLAFDSCKEVSKNNG